MATITSHYANAALHGARRHKKDCNALLKTAHIDSEHINDTSHRVSDSQLTRLVQAIWQALDDEFMGCTKTPCKRGAFAMMGELISHCDTLGTAFLKAVSFYSLITDDIIMQFIQGDHNCELSVEMRNPTLDKDNFFLEFWLVILHRFMSWLVGHQIKLQAVHFIYAKPAHAFEFKHQFNCRCHFTQCNNKLIFSKKYSSLKPIRTQREIAEFIRTSPALLMTIPESDGSYTLKVKQLLTQNLRQQQTTTIADICATLPLSEQTLRRKLKDEGMSFNEIKNDFLRDNAIEKLMFQNLGIPETAEDLGFAEPSSFIRAFKRWTGFTPQRYCRDSAHR